MLICGCFCFALHFAEQVVDMTYPYTQGWPTDPFKQLTPQEMAALLKRIGKPEYEEALL